MKSNYIIRNDVYAKVADTLFIIVKFLNIRHDINELNSTLDPYYMCTIKNNIVLFWHSVANA